MSRRRAPRVEVNFEVKVWGLDRYGKPFMQHARTLDVTNLGARLIGVDCVKAGDTIGIQNGEHKGRFAVVWTGRENTPKAGQIGVQCLEPDKKVFSAQARSAAFAVDYFPGSTEFAFDAAVIPRSVTTDTAAARRKYPRYQCAARVELRQHEDGPAAWGNLSDVSLSGCYVETASTLPVGSIAFFDLHAHDLQVRGRAVVKSSNPQVGMGLAFAHLGPEDQQNLEFLIATLAGIQEMRLEESVLAGRADPAPTVDESVAIAASDEKLSAQIEHVIIELNGLEEKIVAARADPRLIAQFHDAAEHVRQMAVASNQWIDLRTSGKDTSAVVPQLHAEHIRMIMVLAHNILNYLDEGEIHSTERIEELWRIIQQLHKRLSAIFMRLPEETDVARSLKQKR